MALTLASCAGKSVSNLDPSKLDNTVEKCWKVTSTTKVGGYSGSTTEYIWATERYLVIGLQESEELSQGFTKYKYQQASQYKDMESCGRANKQ